MIHKKDLLWLALVLGFSCTAVLGGFVYRIAYFDAESIDYHQEGIYEARSDLLNGRIKIKDASADTLEERLYKNILESDHGIEHERFGFRLAPAHVAEYVSGYNEVMEGAIERRVGKPALTRARERAHELFESEYETEEYAVWSTILDELAVARGAVPVISPQTWDRIGNNASDYPIRIQLPELIKCPPLGPLSRGLLQAIEDYKARNLTRERIKAGFKLESRYIVLDEESMRSFRSAGGWQGYYKKYLNSCGEVRLSRVGFNSDMTEALAYLECGDGDFKILRKQNRTWRIERTVLYYRVVA